MSGETLERIEAQVRESIRSAGLDPVREADAVRALVDDALSAWEHRALAGAVPAITDPAAAARALMDNVSGLGPLHRHFDHPEVEEIWINAPS
ncbi:hypothetical protein [Demequina aestuarii]|uniref:hypothetical protein n=1 Tax=Demequina aestuarii TaxID=327095 RepID=UPI000785B58E|nr:hypothetical protein [Demequina aestuarii]